MDNTQSFRLRAGICLLSLLQAATANAQGQGDQPISERVYRLPYPLPGITQPDSPATSTLNEVWQIAISNDDRLSARRWTTAAAETTLSAANAGRLPTAHLQGGYQLRDNDRRFVSNLPGLPNFMIPYQQRENGSFSANLRVPIYTSGKISHQIASAAARVRVQSAEIEEHRLQLKFEVARDYVGVLLATNNLQASVSSTRSLASHASDVKSLAAKGKVPRNDQLAAEVALANGRYEQIRATHALDRARASLNRRLRRPLDQSMALEPPVIGDLALELPQLTSMATSNRPELAAISAQVDDLNHQACSQRASNRMQVTLEGGYSYTENRHQSPQGITAAGIGVSWSALNRKRDLQSQALSQQARALASLRSEALSRIQLDVRQAWLHVREAKRRKALTRQAVLHAEENLRVNRRKYAMGTATNTAVLQAETLRVQAYRNDNNASHDAVLAVLYLQRVVGTL